MEHLSLLWIFLFLNSIFSDISIAAPTFSILHCLSSFILYTLILCGVFVLSVALINSIYLDKKKNYYGNHIFIRWGKFVYNYYAYWYILTYLYCLFCVFSLTTAFLASLSPIISFGLDVISYIYNLTVYSSLNIIYIWNCLRKIFSYLIFLSS